ncbi:trans-sialidase [Trypanosoma conorhini]|uniref:Trans-sialidase n=1 Tax=Trypanosoma conorhini TaxID=83891 RepID=A0A422MW12_9TRYP|nr:trans-sialidase [Trypanosoma conorhini]RNE97422.1 trans-sialidase [Trypanosoma conorhini]
MRPTTLVVGDDVYMLLGNYSGVADASKWKLLLVKGSVSGSGETKKIAWSETRAVETAGLPKYLTRLVGGGGSGLVLSDGTLVFPMQAIKNGKNILLAMRLRQSETQWKFSSGTTGEGCRDPSIVEWKDGQKLLAMASCEGGSYEVYDSTAAGTAWYTTGEPITRVWGNSLSRQGGYGVQGGFITASFENKKLMLLTMPVYSADAGEEKGELHLWLTDNARVHDVGPVSAAGDDAAASSLLYNSGGSGDELIALYEKKTGDDSYGLAYVRLATQLEQVKEVVRSWTALDAALQSCKASGNLDPQEKGMCKGPLPTKGLVGFLSGKSTGGKWKDEYLCVDATVHGAATKFTNGVTFSGAGAGAEWPVGNLGQNQPYYFANNKFALAATVTIHAVPEEDAAPSLCCG